MNISLTCHLSPLTINTLLGFPGVGGDGYIYHFHSSAIQPTPRGDFRIFRDVGMDSRQVQDATTLNGDRYINHLHSDSTQPTPQGDSKLFRDVGLARYKIQQL